MSEAEAEPATIKAVFSVLRSIEVSAWLFGGWGLDARLGRISREHGDIEFWIERTYDVRSKAALVAAGAAALARSRPRSRVSSDGTVWTSVRPTSTADLMDRIADIETLRGRLADQWPPRPRTSPV